MTNTLSTTIGGNSVSVQEGTYKHDETIDLRSTLEAVVIDSTGSASYQVGEEVAFSDSVLGTLFTGYVDDIIASNLTPNTTNTLDIKFVDQHSLADRAYSKKDYQGQYAGDIFSDLCSTYLAHQGVVANYAIRHDTTGSQFNEGTLSNAVGTNNIADGDLELAPSGTDVVIAENTTSAFGTGTLNGVTATNNTLVPTATNALRLTGSMNVTGVGNPGTFVKIWNGPHTVSPLNDFLFYSIWIDPSSPEIKAAVDIVFTDGSALRNAGGNELDQNGVSPSPSTDLAGLANGIWYSRNVYIGNTKTVSYVALAIAGTKVGQYTAYFKNMFFYDGTTLVNIYAGGASPNTAQQLQTIGYTNIDLAVIPTYDCPQYVTNGNRLGDANSIAGGYNQAYYSLPYRVSSAYSMGNTKLIENSLLSWTAQEPANPYSTSTSPCVKMVIKAQIDNGALLECTNNQPIASLVPGMDLTGRTITFWEEFYALQGWNPEVAPTLTSLTLTLDTSFVCTKNDAAYTTVFSGSESGTTFTNTQQVNNALALTGTTRNWDDSDVSNETAFGASVGQFLVNRQRKINSFAAGTNSANQLIFAGQYQNFTMEIDLQIVANGSTGMIYRTSSGAWSNNAGFYAFAVLITTTSIILSRGTNTNAGGSTTAVATTSLTLSAGDWHRLKVVTNGTTHTIYLDDVQQISTTDTHFNATGYVGMIGINAATFTNLGYFYDNFGIQPTLTGTWVSPSLSLNSVASYGNSIIYWRDRSESVGGSDSVAVNISTNGGSTWTACTNGAPLPTFTSGTSLVGVSLLLQVVLTTTTASQMPAIDNLAVLIRGAFSASGSRISPPLLLNNVGEAGSTLVSWNALQPTNTGILIDTTIDNEATWTNVGSGASGSAPIAGITTRPSVIDDTFTTNTSANYTASALNSPATWTFDTANSRVVATGGNNALLTYTGLSAMNVDAMADLDEADNAGVVVRMVGTTMYALYLYDASATTFSISNTFFLYAIVSGAFTQLATGSISFVRGTPHRFHLAATNTTITATMDGVQLASVTDNRITTAGSAGLLSGSLGRFYQLRIQPFGQNVSALSVKARARLSSTDPTVTSQITDLTLSCHGPNIQNGALIPSTNYNVLSGSKNTLAQDFDDLAKQSTDALGNSFICYIDKNKVPYFQPRNATPSPWIATGLDIRLSTAPTVESSSNLYRNDEFVIGAIDIQAKTKPFTGDGSATNWTMDYNVDSLTSVTVNGVPKLVGVNGIDTGKDYYYTKGQTGITQDKSESPLVGTQTVIFNYNAQVPITVELRNDSAIAARAALDGTDGIVQAADDGTGLNKSAAIQLGSGLLSTQSIIGETFTFTTLRDGLAAGQLLTVFLPALGVVDAQFLITDVSTTWKTTMQNNVQVVQPWHAVTATSGPIVGGWERFMSNVIQGGIS